MSQDNFIPENGVVQIPLTQGYVTVIDAEDADLASMKWRVFISRKTHFYAVRSIAKPNSSSDTQLLHRVILERIVGRPLKRHEQVDHISGDGLDNRRENLRVATHAQNLQNSRKQRNNTSGYKGVTWSKGNKKWMAQVGVNGKHIYLGYFDTPEAAHEAYCEAVDKYHGEFGRTD